MIGGLVKEEKNALKNIILAVILVAITIVGTTDFNAFKGNEEYRIVNMEKTKELFNTFDQDTILICNFDHVQGLVAYYLNSRNTVLLYGSEPEELVSEMIPGLSSLEDPIDICNYIDAGKKVYFLGSFNSREQILEDWNKEYGITSVNHGSFLMERYWFDVFELSIQ